MKSSTNIFTDVKVYGNNDSSKYFKYRSLLREDNSYYPLTLCMPESLFTKDTASSIFKRSLVSTQNGVYKLLHQSISNKLKTKSVFANSLITNTIRRSVAASLDKSSSVKTIANLEDVIIDKFNEAVSKIISHPISNSMNIISLDCINTFECQPSNRILSTVFSNLYPSNSYSLHTTNIPYNDVHKIIFNTIPDEAGNNHSTSKTTTIFTNFLTIFIALQSVFSYVGYASLINPFIPYIVSIPMIKKSKIKLFRRAIMYDTAIQRSWFEIWIDIDFINTFSRYKFLSSFIENVYTKYLNDGYKLAYIKNIYKELFVTNDIIPNKKTNEINYVEQTDALYKATLHKMRGIVPLEKLI